MADTPQKKKAIDLRASGFSLREISEKLNIPRKKVEELLAAPVAAQEQQPAPTSEKKAPIEKKAKATKKGK